MSDKNVIIMNHQQVKEITTTYKEGLLIYNV